MNTYSRAIKYFKEFTRIPRIPLREEKARNWIIDWAQKRGLRYDVDDIGNLLVVAPGEKNHRICLQSHMDMVCVSDNGHDFEKKPITIIEKDGKISAKHTSLGADNGIGVTTMMALAEIEDRPTLELLFTVGEEIGLVGAQHISLPLEAKYALNLDWSDSDTIGIGCGGTLLMQGTTHLDIASCESQNLDDVYTVRIHGMQGGHSGEDIRHYRGNAIIELLKTIQEIAGITHIGEIHGGEADNAIPHSASMIVRYNKHPNLLNNELSHLQKNLRTKYKHTTITLSADKSDKHISHLYARADILPFLSRIIDTGTGVHVWGKNNTPLSSWNLGICTIAKNILSTSYFVRSNLEDDIDTLKKTLSNNLSETVWTLSHESPPWNYEHPESDFFQNIQKCFLDEDDVPLPAIKTHAAVECGILSKKYPQTEWISVGATISDMHTTRESMLEKDFENFVERMEELIMNI